MLNGTTHPALAGLVSRMIEQRYDKGYIFYMPGDPADTLFCLKVGRVQQYHLSPDGRKLVTTTLGPGDVFGITTLAENQRHHLFAETLDDCVVLVLDRWQVRQLLLREPQTVLLLINQLARRLSHAQDKLHELVFEPIPVRLARCLLEIAENGIVEGYSHQEIGEILGTYRETVTVALNRFKEGGLIDLGRCRIRILDPTGLHRIAGNSKEVTQPNTRSHDRDSLVIELRTVAA
jgi:CRP-like cAMP-binding protein